MSSILDLNDVLALVTADEEPDIAAVDSVHEVEPEIQMDRVAIESEKYQDLTLSHTVEVHSGRTNDSDEESSQLTTEDDTDDWMPSTSADDTETEPDKEDLLNTGDRSRKRKRNAERWKKNQRKRQRQSGQAYTGSRGQSVPKRKMKTKKNCDGQCKFKCSRKVSSIEREKIFQAFWSLKDDEKNHFYNKTIDRGIKARKRAEDSSRRKFSYAYNFFTDDNKTRVCKEFYLTTLDISQRRVSYYFEKKHDAASGTPLAGDLRGTRTKDRIPHEMKQGAREHINSFPRVESHYCRESSTKQYLDQDLNLTKMYRLYLEKCETDQVDAVKEHIYRNIFNDEFNLAFFSPKKDRCDRCEEFKMKEKFNLLDDPLKSTYAAHRESKIATKRERDHDRESSDPVLCFDLENVISCPRANISSFFYRRKLSVYNLTAHFSLDSSAYCAIWHEKTAGRGANEIASALVAILENIYKEHHPQKLIIWSDSCVAQNKNSALAYALKDFQRVHDVEIIEQKFCEPGHSCIQEVDSIHSCIERQLSKSEVFSPLGVMKCLKKAMRKPVNVIQMREGHFRRYLESARLLHFKDIPFTKVKSLLYNKDDLFSVKYKKSFDCPDVTLESIRPRELSRRMSSPPRSPSNSLWPTVKQLAKKPELAQDKIKDIQAMLKFMTPVDKSFMSGLISSMV